MTAARTDDLAALPGMETANPAPPTAIDRSPWDAAGPVPASSKSALDALVHYVRKADIDSFLATLGSKGPFARRIVVDTSGAPWENRLRKVSCDQLRAESSRTEYCRGGPDLFNCQYSAIPRQ